MLFWSLLLAVVSIAYAFLIIWLLPKLILKSKYPVTHPTDRGLKKYKFGELDYAVVYEPSLTARKYMSQYILAKKEGKKTFTGKFAPNVSYIDFDLVLFDATGASFRIIRSMDIATQSGLTKEIELPSETAYASVLINQANKQEIKRPHSAKIGGFRIFLFGFLALIVSIGASVGTLFAFSNAFGGIFKETFAEKMIASGWIFIFPTITAAVCIIGVCLALFKRNSKR